MGRTRDPYMLTLKYPAKCAETGKEMAKGDKALYYPSAAKGKNLFHPESNQAAEYRSWQQDLSTGNNY
jgi:hypothetical protein